MAELGKSGVFASLGIEVVSRRYVAAAVAQGAELLKNASFKPE